MFNPKKEISIASNSSWLDLKNELQQSKKNKELEKSKSSFKSTIKDWKRKHKEVIENNQQEEESRQKRLKEKERQYILEEKSKLYDILTTQPERLSSSALLVDFERKNTEQQQKRNVSSLLYSDLKDEFGRDLVMEVEEQIIEYEPLWINEEDDYKEYQAYDQFGYHMVPDFFRYRNYDLLRQKNQESQNEWAGTTSLLLILEMLLKMEKTKNEYYSSQNEMRNLGIGYFAFSQDEKERLLQQETLEEISQETKREQEKAQSLQKERREKMKERVRGMKQKRYFDDAEQFLNGVLP